MCNRFNLKFPNPTDQKYSWIQLFPERSLFDDYIDSHRHHIRPEYKPTDSIFHLRANSTELSDSENSEFYAINPNFDTWGAKPDWSNKPITNSRSEKLFTSPFWRPFISKNRCLIPATSFFECQEILGKKNKKEITFRNSSTCLAGIYGKWEEIGIQKLGIWLTILTQEGNPLMKQIHNSGENRGRQPVVMREEYWDKWLSPIVSNEREIVSMIEQFSEEEISVEGNDGGMQPGLFG